jgi:uncharacterized SAM-binding protein YcdF (DUF218 family)
MKAPIKPTDPNGRDASTKRRPVFRRVLAIVAILIGAYSSYLLTINQVAYQDQRQSADAILVLGAGVARTGSPSFALVARVKHAVMLYREGYAPLIALTGGARDDRPTEADVAYRIARRMGVPAEAIIIETTSQTTTQNVINIAPLLRERGVQSVIVVTSPFHAMRSRYIVQSEGFDASVSPTPQDPAERRPWYRVYYILRESVLIPVHLVFGL